MNLERSPLYLTENPVGKLKNKAKLLFSEKYRTELDERLNENLGYISETYGVHVDMGGLTRRDKKSGVAHLKTLRLDERVVATDSLREELGKYPPEYIKSLRPSRLRVVKELEDNVESLGGWAEDKGGRLYLSTEDGDDFFKGVIHHELYHLADTRWIPKEYSLPIAGVIFSSPKESAFNAAWRTLNPGPGRSRYSRGAHNMATIRDAKNSHDKKQGFVSYYGASTEFEDRATVAEKLMMDPIGLMEQAEHDKVLERKMETIKALYKRRSIGKMDENYFVDLAGEAVQEGYWTKATKN